MHDDYTLGPRAGVSGLGNRRLFVLALWISLATAIVCAVVPAGLPATRTTGSAFDPSTTIVALRSKPPVTVKTSILRSDDGGSGMGGADGGEVLIPAAAIRFFGTIAVNLGAAVAVSALFFVPRALGRALYARPPPNS